MVIQGGDTQISFVFWNVDCKTILCTYWYVFFFFFIQVTMLQILERLKMTSLVVLVLNNTMYLFLLSAIGCFRTFLNTTVMHCGCGHCSSNWMTASWSYPIESLGIQGKRETGDVLPHLAFSLNCNWVDFRAKDTPGMWGAFRNALKVDSWICRTYCAVFLKTMLHWKTEITNHDMTRDHCINT